jgi:ribosomal protein S18 acetylase RimI-like enzyme
MAWAYRDRAGNIAGFGTLEVCKEYQQFTGGKFHFYIPLLAVNPTEGFKRRGHGYSIVQHLIAEAVLFAQENPADFLSDILFLDVYAANQPAIALYKKCGFVELNPTEPVLDPQENNEPYIIMAKKVAISPTP